MNDRAILVLPSGEVLGDRSLVNGEGADIRMASVVLGLDPATRASGWAALAVAGDIERVIESGVYHAAGSDLMGRLVALYGFAGDLVKKFDPALVCVETVFHGRNAQTTIALAQVGAAVRLGAYAMDAPVIIDCSPAERCGAVGLSGKAGKTEIVSAVRAIYSEDIRNNNAADAVAIAAFGAAWLRREALGLAV